MTIGAIFGDKVVDRRTNELDQGPSGSLEISGETPAHGGNRLSSAK